MTKQPIGTALAKQLQVMCRWYEDITHFWVCLLSKVYCLFRPKSDDVA